MQYGLFKVGSRLYCVWEVNLHERNLEFINAIDPEYFEYQALAHIENLNSEHKQRAALALRNSFHHGLETLFALICAVLQAPDCIHGWMLKYTLSDLRALLTELNSGRVNFFHKHNLEKPLSWLYLSERVHEFSNKDPERVKETVLLFAQLWQRLCRVYLDEQTVNEYNSIKHGHRALSGGFTFAIGVEKEYGVPAPQENMTVIGASEFGSSFFVAEAIQGKNKIKGDPNFKTGRYALNWDAEATAHALNLISTSINNVKSYALRLNGAKPGTVIFTRPRDPEYFDKPWETSVGVIGSSLGVVVDEPQIKRFTREEIEEKFKKAAREKRRSA